MSRKNTFSYIMWFVYTIAVCVSLFGISGRLSRQSGVEQWVGIGISGLLLLDCGLFVLLIHRFTKSAKYESKASRNHIMIWESIVATVLVIIGIIMRVRGLSDAGEDAAYYEFARVAGGQTVPQVVHGAVYVYLQLLHLVYGVFGNQFLAGIVLQIVLQVITGVFLYLTVRKLSGVCPALVMLGFIMVGPFMVRKSLSLSPEILFMAVCAILLFISAKCMMGNRKPHICLITGVFISLACYLDIIGIILLLFTVVGLLRINVEEDDTVKKRLINAALCTLGCAVGFALFIVVDAFVSSKGIFSVLNAWWKVFEPGAFTMNFMVEITNVTFNAIFLMLLLMIGVFSYWCGNDTEGQSIWILSAVILFILQCFGMTTKEVSGYMFIYVMAAVLAGTGVRRIFASEGGKCAVNSGDVIITENEERNNGQIETEESEPKVKLIDNPLPLPKKHVKRVLDYDIKATNEADDFDVQIDENDNYDL